MSFAEMKELEQWWNGLDKLEDDLEELMPNKKQI